jgi:hypothetical protein
MGAVQRDLEEFEMLVQECSDLLVEAEAARRCDFHEEIVISKKDDDTELQAYATGMKMVADQKIEATPRRLVDAMERAIENLEDECGICAARFSKD